MIIDMSLITTIDTPYFGHTQASILLSAVDSVLEAVSEETVVNRQAGAIVQSQISIRTNLSFNMYCFSSGYYHPRDYAR